MIQLYDMAGYVCSGVSVYTSTGLKATQRFVHETILNIVEIDIKLSDILCLTLTAIYRPPNADNLTLFYQLLEERLMSSRCQYKIIAGDINLNIIGNMKIKIILIY